MSKHVPFLRTRQRKFRFNFVADGKARPGHAEMAEKLLPTLSKEETADFLRQVAAAAESDPRVRGALIKVSPRMGVLLGRCKEGPIAGQLVWVIPSCRICRDSHLVLIADQDRGPRETLKTTYFRADCHPMFAGVLLCPLYDLDPEGTEKALFDVHFEAPPTSEGLCKPQ